MKKVLLVILLLFILTTGVMAKPIVLKLGGVHGVNTPETKGLYYFAKLVEQETNGELKIEVYPAGQLGDAVSMIENTIMGAQDLFANVMDWNQNVVQDFAILAMPFAFEDINHILRFMETDTYKNMEDRMIDEQGLRILAKNWYRLPRAIVTKDPVFSIEDLQGRQMRMPSLETYFKTWQVVGINPIEIPWAEAYHALERGMVVGMDSPLASIRGMGFYKAAPFITNTRHLMAPFNILINEDRYQGLGEGLRDKLLEAAIEAGNYYTELVKNSFDQEKKEMLSEGAVYVEIDTGPFAEKARKAAYDFEEDGFWSKGLYDKVRNLVSGE